MANSPRTIVAPIALCLLLTGLLAGAVLSRSLQGLPPAEVGAVLTVNTQPPATPEPPKEIPAESEQPEPGLAPAHPTPAQQPTVASEPGITILFPESRGDELRTKLKSFSEAGHDVLSYRKAREVMYWRADNVGGIVTTIYGQKPIQTQAHRVA